MTATRRGPQEAAPRAVLAEVLGRSGADLSARQVLCAEKARWAFAAQLAAEQDTIATVVDRDRRVAPLRRSGLRAAQLDAVLASDGFGPLRRARRAEAAGHHADVLVGAHRAAHPGGRRRHRPRPAPPGGRRHGPEATNRGPCGRCTGAWWRDPPGAARAR